MRRRLVLRCALGVVISFSGAMVTMQTARADSIGQQEQHVKDVVAEIDRQNQSIDQYNEAYLGAMNDKSVVEADIAVSERHIASQEAKLGVLQNQLASVAVEQFMGGDNGALGPLFVDTVAITDGLERAHLATVAVNAGAASTDDYEALLTDLAREQKSLKTKQQHSADLAFAADANRAKAENAAADQQARLVNEKAKLGDLIQQEQVRQDQAAQAAYAQQQAAAQAAAAAKSAAAATGAAAQASGTGSKTVGGSSNTGTSVTVNSPGNSASSSSVNPGGSDKPAGSGSSGGNAGSSDKSTSGGTVTSDNGSAGTGQNGSPSGSSNVPPVSSRASIAVNAARAQLGVPYEFARMAPGVAFDCSGITAYAWAQAGVVIPHQSAAQYASTPHVPLDQAQPGDLIFSYSPISHVGLYVGGGSMIHAPNTGSFVSYTTVRWSNVVGVSRPG